MWGCPGPSVTELSPDGEQGPCRAGQQAPACQDGGAVWAARVARAHSPTRVPDSRAGSMSSPCRGGGRWWSCRGVHASGRDPERAAQLGRRLSTLPATVMTPLVVWRPWGMWPQGSEEAPRPGHSSQHTSWLGQPRARRAVGGAASASARLSTSLGSSQSSAHPHGPQAQWSGHPLLRVPAESKPEPRGAGPAVSVPSPGGSFLHPSAALPAWFPRVPGAGRGIHGARRGGHAPTPGLLWGAGTHS